MLRGFPVRFLMAAVIAVAALSCSKGPKVIPKKQMVKIYQEMFIADQWLAENPEKRNIADTSWFYLPIFEKYGYDADDYRSSVDYYLSDPKRYADLMDEVVEGLDERQKSIYRSVQQQEKIRHRADSIAAAMKAFAPEESFTNYGDLFYVNSMTDRIDIRKNEKGVYFPVPVVEDTVYHGPELVIKDSAAINEDLEVASAPEEFKPIVWRK